jgi:hypothetical protein
MAKEYELIEYKGGTARRYKDGSIRNERGQMLVKLESPAAEITPANARSLAQKRWEAHTERVRQRVTEELAATFPGVTTPEDAYAEVVAAQTMTLVGSEHPRFDDVDKLGQIMGARPTAAEQRQTQEAASASSSLAALVAQLIEQQATVTISVTGRDTVEGRVLEDE